MKNYFSKVWLTTFNALLLAIGISLACADYSDDYTGGINSSFTPEIYVDKGYTPLFYYPDMPFYGIGFDTEHNTRFSNDVTDEWYNFLNRKVAKEYIKTLLLTDATYDELIELHLYITQKKESDAVAKWQKRIPLNDKRVADFIDFASLAMYVDKIAAPTKYDPWDYQNEDLMLAKIDDNVINMIRWKYENATDPFMKNRFWFLTLKAMFYSYYK